MLSCAKRVCLSLVVLLLSAMLSQSICAQSDLTTEDIIAGIEHSESLLLDYQCRYKTTKRWLYKEIVSQSETGLGKVPPQILRLEPKTEEEKQKAMYSRYTWRAKGAKFFYARDFEDEINDLAHSEKHAFNGKQHLQLSNHKGILSGVVESPLAAYGSISTDVIRPDDFFAELQNRPIVDWLKEDQVTVSPTVETVAGRPCYVIECVNDRHSLRGKLWISPDFGFRPVKMEYYLSNGAFCSHTVTEMKEVAQGVWFPTKGTKEWHIPNPPGSESLVLYSVAEFEVDPTSLKVNSGVSDDEFVFTFPKGTQVYDRIADLLYVVGEGLAEEDVDDLIEGPGEVKTPEAGEGATPIPPEKAVEPREVGRERQTAPTAQPAEPGPNIRFLLAGLTVGVVAALALIFLWRRRQKSKVVRR